AAICLSSLGQLVRPRPMSSERSLGPIYSPSISGALAMASTFSNACIVSTITRQITSSLARCTYASSGSDNVGRLAAMLRQPRGAYRQARPAASASAEGVTIGTMTPYAPASRTYEIYSGEFLGRRTIGTASELPIAWIQATTDSWLTPTPCCQSMTTASKPAWPIISAIYGLPVEHQPCTAGLP